MDFRAPGGVEADESNITGDPSTAPTTPGGSLSFSPALQPFRDGDNHDVDVTSLAGRANGDEPVTVRNICCVGAGYVGK
jgi:UDPglucose 6-dehydrogenase